MMSKFKQIKMLKLDKLVGFENTPFEVRNDESLTNLLQSVRDNGVLTPIIVSHHQDGEYQILSGHRRVRVCAMLGIDTIPAIVKDDLDHNEAILIVIDSNLSQRELLISEKAKAYKMKLEVLKTVEYKQKLKAKKYNAREILSDMTSVGGRQIQRYVRLTNLVPSLMRLVDEGKLAITPAVELSYLNGQQQEHIVNAMQQIWADDSRIADPNVTYAQAKILHNLSNEGELNVDSVIDVLSQPKPNQKERLTIPMDDIRPYMPQGYTDRQCMQYLIKLAKCEYQRQLEIYKKSQKNKKEIGER